MKTKEVTLYICEHCKKKYFRKKACEVHESMCYYNPENKTTCYGCRFLAKKETDVDGDGYVTIRKKLFFCNKKEVFLHPPRYRNTHYDLAEENVTMPLECSEFEKPTLEDLEPF